MNTGRAIILNPSRPDSIKRREFLLDSLRESGLEWFEEIEESRITITWRGVPKPARPRALARRLPLPPPVTLEKALKSRFICATDDVEYWDEMVRLTAERESMPVARIQVRTGWNTEQRKETWAVTVSEHLAINRVDGYWTVTHVVTGLAAGTASTFRDALQVARKVAQWSEWALVRTKDDVTPEFKCQATEAFKAAA